MSVCCNIDAKPEDVLADTELLADLMRQTLDCGSVFRFNAAGASMLPFIHSGDTVSVSPLGTDKPRPGDIVAFKHPLTNRVLLHRVIQTRHDQFLVKGDNTRGVNDGWVRLGDILGKVTKVESEGQAMQFGLGRGRKLIALLSRWDVLVPAVRALRKARSLIKRTAKART